MATRTERAGPDPVEVGVVRGPQSPRCYSACMKLVLPVAAALPMLLLVGCTHGYALATVNVTPVVQNAEGIDVWLEVTKSNHSGSDSKAAAPGVAVTFQVAAGKVWLTASGSAHESNADTGGDVYDCNGETDLRARWGRVYDVEIVVDCRYLYTLD
jgi:hypothetical protein